MSRSSSRSPARIRTFALASRPSRRPRRRATAPTSRRAPARRRRRPGAHARLRAGGIRSDASAATKRNQDKRACERQDGDDPRDRLTRDRPAGMDTGVDDYRRSGPRFEIELEKRPVTIGICSRVPAALVRPVFVTSDHRLPASVRTCGHPALEIPASTSSPTAISSRSPRPARPVTESPPARSGYRAVASTVLSGPAPARGGEARTAASPSASPADDARRSGVYQSFVGVPRAASPAARSTSCGCGPRDPEPRRARRRARRTRAPPRRARAYWSSMRVRRQSRNCVVRSSADARAGTRRVSRAAYGDRGVRSCARRSGADTRQARRSPGL